MFNRTISVTERLPNFRHWVEVVEKPALRRLAWQKWWKESLTIRWAKLVLKELGLLAVMFSVTIAVVTCETGDFQKALHIACIAGPIKALSAAIYGKIVH